jgi:P4 family phage/plasmid primase-like protien
MVAAGDRDNQVVRHAGYLARVVQGIDKSQQLTLVEALAQIYTFVEDFTDRISGDAMDPNKGVAKLLEFLAKDVEKGRTLPNGWDTGLDFEHPTIDFLRERNEQQRWTLSRAVAWLSSKVEEDPDNLDYVVERVFELIVLVSKDEKFGESMMRLLADKIPTIIGMKIKKTDLVKAFNDARRATDTDNLEDQEAIARAVLEDLARTGEVRHALGGFWQWSGACWKQIDETPIYNLIATSIKGSQLARRDSDYTAIIRVMARIAAADLVTSEENGINFANGFVGEDLLVVDHDPKYGATFTLPFEYDRERASQCPRWFGFLDSCWGNEPDYVERMMALQEMFAATLFKIAPRYQKAFLLFGRAGTGKTQVLHVLRALVPAEAIAEVGPEKWGERFTLTGLVGKAVNICGELPENGMIAGAMFKRIIEADPVVTEFKGRNQFSFRPEIAHWFASNYLPVSRDSTNGFTRRWLVLDFNRVVPKDEIIVDLAEQIVAEEREAIVAWALDGLRRLIENDGFTEPKCHLRRVGEMRRTNNSVHAFLADDHKFADGEGEVKGRAVYDKYVFHMREVGRSAPAPFERFMQMIEELGYEKGRDELGDYTIKGLIER